MNEHRVPMLGAALRRHADPARSTDPKVRELVAALAVLEVAPPPRAEFRAELRAQLVAVTPRLVAEGERPAAPARADRAEPTKSTENVETAERARRFRFAKPLIAAACVLTAFVLLLGGAVLLSRHALPGDALYGIKRASEDTEYSLTGGQVAKGKLKLEFAGRRIGEVADLLPRASSMGPGSGAVADSGAISSDTAGLVRDTLGSAEGDVRTAAQLLGSDAVRNDDAGPLTAIISWSPDQLAAMRQILARIPAGALQQRAGQTLELLRAAQARASLLRTQLGCSCLDAARTDDLGPVPCTGPCTARTGGTAPNPHPSPGPSRTGAPHGSGTAASSNAPGAGTTSPAPGAPSSAPGGKGSHPVTHPSSPAGGSSSPVPFPRPTSPLPVPTLPGLGGGTSGGKTGGKTGSPISVNSCSASLSLGPIGIGVGAC